ncbi:sporulation kinase B [Halalkalibacter akibai JCM 9157]|uniref:histidine kinase n=1 Tax=Halalkalibacter akibai (strain ATCC 43226 / DSM 21942 / CIP 109018 / JCM 9157 / 1139) TaxID=1236973 RepID=W4QRE0_HALA3|nr:sporulation kinase B [Halalkalibacter akibai JCM 9157]
MREFYNIVNKKIYYLSCVFMIIIMSMGLFVLNPRMEAFDFGYVLHLTLVTLFSICILIYPKYETYMLRFITITIASLYFYALFFLYPDTWSTFIFLCLIPAFSILYFDSKIFYFSLVLNFIFISVTLLYIILVDQGKLFSHIEQDLVGNTLNFVGSQIVIFLIYFLSDVRNKKQQLYYEQIQQTERLKTTGQLAAAVAHEIRNPLTVVKGFLQLYEKEPTFDDKKKSILN